MQTYECGPIIAKEDIWALSGKNKDNYNEHKPEAVIETK